MAQTSVPPVMRIGASVTPQPRVGHAERVMRWRAEARELVQSCCPKADTRAVESAAEKIVKMLQQIWTAEGIR